jgi:phenylalanyl-tRNA synthetase alpha chain
LENCKIDTAEWQGFAFALGIDRIAMLLFGIDDIRLFYNGDLRLVNQF